MESISSIDGVNLVDLEAKWQFGRGMNAANWTLFMDHKLSKVYSLAQRAILLR